MVELSEADGWAVLASVEGLGAATLIRLLGAHGNARRVLELAASASGRRVLAEDPRSRLASGVLDGLVAATAGADAFIRRLRDAGITIRIVDDPAYPARLRALAEPPPVLFIRGSEAELSREHAVAVVGTRRPTEAGRRVAARIADALARVGAVVVSGLAVGIDGAAHAAVVDAGRPTTAVLGSGHDRLFPRAHRRLAESIVAAGGVLLSELPPDARATRGTFPRRNRLISGLADATVVVEAAERSGALITARWALEQGRGCFLVPGPIDARASVGCNAFLRAYPMEARLVAGVAELIEDLDLAPGPAGSGARAAGEGTAERPVSVGALLASLGPASARVAAELVRGRTTVDELAAATDLTVATVLGTLTLLEMEGLAVAAYGRYRPGGSLAAASPGLLTA